MPAAPCKTGKRQDIAFTTKNTVFNPQPTFPSAADHSESSAPQSLVAVVGATFHSSGAGPPVVAGTVAGTDPGTGSAPH